MELAEVEGTVAVRGVHNGHVQLFLADHVHEHFRGTFRQVEADAFVLFGIIDEGLGNDTIQGTGDEAHADNDGGTDLAVTKDQGCVVQLLQRGVHLLLVESSLIGKADIPAYLLKQLYAAQGIFQIVDGTAQGWLGDAKPCSCQGVVFRLPFELMELEAEQLEEAVMCQKVKIENLD